MTGTPFFVKPCPACARLTQIKVTYLGHQVRCQHCGRIFLANDPECESAALEDPVQYWIKYTDIALDSPEGLARNPR